MPATYVRQALASTIIGLEAALGVTGKTQPTKVFFLPSLELHGQTSICDNISYMYMYIQHETMRECVLGLHAQFTTEIQYLKINKQSFFLLLPHGLLEDTTTNTYDFTMVYF